MDFEPLNSFFDHIYVITVEAAMDRQAKVREQLEGLNFKFFIGAYKKDFTIDELIESGVYNEVKAKQLHRYDKPMNTGQIGCAWSHRLVYEDMLENGYKRVLILEDDIAVHKEGLAQITEIISELPPDWELWYLDYHKNLRRNFGTWLRQKSLHALRVLGKLKWSHKTISNLYARKYKPHLFKAGYHQFASAYALTPAAAKKLTQLQTPICFPSDTLLAHACSNTLVNAFVSVPKVFLNESQIQDKRSKASYVEE